MNKSIVMLLFVCLVGNLSAELKYDAKTARYSSVPASREINQNDYHQLVWNCIDILRAYAQKHAALLAMYPDTMRSSAYDPNNIAGKNAVEEYLQRIASPTSMRLLADLQAIKFNF